MSEKVQIWLLVAIMVTVATAGPLARAAASDGKLSEVLMATVTGLIAVLAAGASKRD